MILIIKHISLILSSSRQFFLSDLSVLCG